MTTTDPAPSTREAFLVLDELRAEAEAVVHRINSVTAEVEKNLDPEALNLLSRLPRTTRLDEIESFGRSLTTAEVWSRAPAQDRAHLAEVRCMVDDAVVAARSLDYEAATAHTRRALNRMVRVRDRDRTDTKKLTKAVETAFEDALHYLTDVVVLFSDVAKDMQAVEKGG